MVGADRVEEGTLVSRSSPPWLSHRLRHPELTGACLNGIHGFCSRPAQARSTAFMEGQCTGFGSLPFYLFSWSSQSCVWFFLEFPELRGQTLPRQDLIVSSETRSLIRRRALNQGMSLEASERPMRLFEPLFAPPRNVLVQLDGQGVLSLRMRLML